MARLLNKPHGDLKISSHEGGRRERRGLWIWLSIVALIATLIVIGCIYSLTWLIYASIGTGVVIIFSLICGACTVRYLNTYDNDQNKNAKDKK